MKQLKDYNKNIEKGEENACNEDFSRDDNGCSSTLPIMPVLFRLDYIYIFAILGLVCCYTNFCIETYDLANTVKAVSVIIIAGRVSLYTGYASFICSIYYLFIEIYCKVKKVEIKSQVNTDLLKVLVGLLFLSLSMYFSVKSGMVV